MSDEIQQPTNTQFLKESFATEQKLLDAVLRASGHITHAGDRGEVNEQHFIDFLRHYLPNRYTVEKAIVIDSTGCVSHSIDVVIFDRQYTPTLFDNTKHRYVPAEAVYAVFECKPTINKGYLEYAADKAASVRRLKRTSIPINQISGPAPAKKLFDIVSGILAIDVDWKDHFGDTFQALHRAMPDKDHAVNCGFATVGASFDTYAGIGSYALGPPDNALAHFVFRLLGQLQSLGTVPGVNWMAYAEQLGHQQK